MAMWGGRLGDQRLGQIKFKIGGPHRSGRWCRSLGRNKSLQNGHLRECRKGVGQDTGWKSVGNASCSDCE